MLLLQKKVGKGIGLKFSALFIVHLIIRRAVSFTRMHTLFMYLHSNSTMYLSSKKPFWEELRIPVCMCRVFSACFVKLKL